MAVQWVGQLCHRVSMLAVAAEGVMTVKEHPTHIILNDFATSLGDLASSLKELQKELEVHPLTRSIESQQRNMEAEMTAVEQLVMAHRAQSQFTSLLSCPFLLLKLQSCRGNLSKGLESITPVACSPLVKLQISRTQRQLRESPPKLGLKEQNLIDLLSTITEGSTNLRCKELAEQVAEYLGVALCDAAFAENLAEAKKDIKKADICDDNEFSLYLDQCTKALEKGLAYQEEPVGGDHADFLSTPSSPGSSYFASKEVVAPSSPLPSFICPITKQVMKDPVQIASGQTYERNAILQWFKDGKTTCPLGEKLKNTKMKPNYALKQSISEWRERNYNIRLDNAEWRLRSFQPMEQARGARDIKLLCEEDGINKYGVASRKLIPLLIRLADTPTTSVNLRELCFNALSALAQDHQENQETLVFEGVIDVLVRTLRKYDEAEPAINLLKVLSASPKIAEIISRTPDAVLLLVTFLGHENENLVVSVKAVLVNLPTSDENIVIMAEANLMKPLVTRLVEGGKESKILMARTLARLEHMPESSKSLASTRETIKTLTNMTNSEDEEEVDSAILALKNLSASQPVGILIADCTGLEVLIRLLTSKKTSAITKIGASYIVANVLVAVGNQWRPSEDRDADIDHFVETFFILISSSTTPPAAQSHLLQGLLGLAEGKDTGHAVKAIMIRRNAFSVLIPHFRGKKPEARRDSLKLFTSLARKHGAEAWMAIKISSGTLQLLVEMLKAEEISEPEKVAAARIISHLPEDDHSLTGTLRSLNIVPTLVSYLTSSNQSIQEACVAALVRYTSPDLLDLQKTLAQMQVIPILVTLLDSRRPRVKTSAAQGLANFSKSTTRLVKPVAPNKWWQCFKPPLESCKLHSGICTVESTFCLLMAEAIYPLLNMVAEDDGKIAEVALEALFTLVDNDQWEKGCHIIHQANGISTILGNLPKCTPRAQDISINMCEKFFRISQFQNSFGPMAQMHIITIAQQAAPKTKDVAGRILRQLDLLQTQSHYWINSTSK
ncbi:hypothetical protein M758_8G143700 [Ceratodon purpureus]|nr:hypothetical protein M758_8G143700 [Ceratodon purpureus]